MFEITRCLHLKRLRDPPKRLYLSTKVHGTISRTIRILIITAERTSNFTLFVFSNYNDHHHHQASKQMIVLASPIQCATYTMFLKFPFNIIFRNTTWISYRFHLRQSHTWSRRNFGTSLNCMSDSGPGASLPVSQFTLFVVSWMRGCSMSGGNQTPPALNGKVLSWEISAAGLAALRFSSVPPGRYRDRLIPRPTLSQSTIRPISWYCFLGHCTLNGRWVHGSIVTMKYVPPTRWYAPTWLELEDRNKRIGIKRSEFRVFYLRSNGG